MTFLTLTGLGAPLILDILAINPVPGDCSSSYLLTWLPASAGPYVLERRFNGGVWSQVYQGELNTFNESGLTLGTWEYRVRYEADENSWSNTVSHYTEPYGTILAGYMCVGTTKYQRIANGSCGVTTGAVLEVNSVDCGYVPPPVGVCDGTNFTNACNVIAVKFASFDMGIVNTTKICADFECTFHNGPGGVTIKVDGVQVAEQTRFGSVIPRQVVSFTGTFNGHVIVTAVAAGTSNAGNGTAKLYEVSWA